jgi:hypothetical protein
MQGIKATRHKGVWFEHLSSFLCLFAFVPFQQKTLSGMRGFITMNKAELIS